MINVIGDVVDVRDIDEYVVKIPKDNGATVRLGQFVKIDTPAGVIMGVVSHMSATAREELMPYTSKEQRSRYLPYLDDFTMNYIVMHALGTMQHKDGGTSGSTKNGNTNSGTGDTISYVMDTAPSIGLEVEAADPGDILKFHTPGGKHTFSYMSMQKSKLESRVVSNMISQLEAVMPESIPILASVRRYIQMGGI